MKRLLFSAAFVAAVGLGTVAAVSQQADPYANNAAAGTLKFRWPPRRVKTAMPSTRRRLAPSTRASSTTRAGNSAKPSTPPQAPRFGIR